MRFVKDDKHFSKYYEGIYILFNTGVRISEFCGLTVSDIDFQNHTFRIDHQLQRERNGKYTIVDTKTTLVTPHVCRHTYCSNMAKSGISPKTLQYLMGHSDINVTLNVYTHIDIEDVKADIKQSKKRAIKGRARASQSDSKAVNF